MIAKWRETLLRYCNSRHVRLELTKHGSRGSADRMLAIACRSDGDRRLDIERLRFKRSADLQVQLTDDGDRKENGFFFSGDSRDWNKHLHEIWFPKLH